MATNDDLLAMLTSINELLKLQLKGTGHIELDIDPDTII